jgi:hypothetical protein
MVWLPEHRPVAREGASSSHGHQSEQVLLPAASQVSLLWVWRCRAWIGLSSAASRRSVVGKNSRDQLRGKNKATFAANTTKVCGRLPATQYGGTFMISTGETVNHIVEEGEDFTELGRLPIRLFRANMGIVWSLQVDTGQTSPNQHKKMI